MRFEGEEIIPVLAFGIVWNSRGVPWSSGGIPGAFQGILVEFQGSASGYSRGNGIFFFLFCGNMFKNGSLGVPDSLGLAFPGMLSKGWGSWGIPRWFFHGK